MATDLFGGQVAQGRAMGSHQSATGGKDEWLTPPDLIEQLGPFDLDPCAPITRPWDTAKRHYTIADDGLSKPWEGFVWCNPPYARADRWLARMANHANGIALLFARTETLLWHNYVWPHATAVLFFAGRLHFHHVNGERAKANAGAPSALIAYGNAAHGRLVIANRKHYLGVIR